METKQIIAILGACVLVCILTAIVNAVRSSTAELPEESIADPVYVTMPSDEDETESFWDSVRRQQKDSTSAEENGTDAGDQTADAGAETTPAVVDVYGNVITEPQYDEDVTNSDAVIGDDSTETDSMDSIE